MIKQSCSDAGVTLFKHCMGKCCAVHRGIYILMVLMIRLNLKRYVYCKSSILSVCEKKFELLNL